MSSVPKLAVSFWLLCLFWVKKKYYKVNKRKMVFLCQPKCLPVHVPDIGSVVAEVFLLLNLMDMVV